MPASAEEENKRLAKHWLDAISEHRVEEICALTAPAWQMHGGPPALPPGPAGVRTLFAAFGPEALNTFVAHPPFVWLPAVLVLTAVAGHLMITRALYN